MYTNIYIYIPREEKELTIFQLPTDLAYPILFSCPKKKYSSIEKYPATIPKIGYTNDPRQAGRV